MNNYTVYITPETFQEIKALPGNIRQRIKKAIFNLASNPRPSSSKRLKISKFEPELWRLRLESWRIVYAINEADNIVDIVAVRKRPPYDYGDLVILLEQLSY